MRFNKALIVFFLILLARFATLEVSDLTDPTESRYAVAAQEMLLQDNWLTPKFYQDGALRPYLGKPPFHFWLIASAYELFGMDEWVARLPSFFSFLIICFCVWGVARKYYDQKVAVNSILIISSSALMFVFSGTCIVDVSLSASITVVVTSFLLLLKEEGYLRKKLYSAIFFIALAIGFLIKGPVAVVLSFMPIFIWLLLNKSLRTVFKLDIVLGSILFFVVLSPWFILQEKSNPGFLKYFFINENILRFLVKDYGDKYGNGHRYFFGSSWWMLWVAFLPWSFMPTAKIRSIKAFLKLEGLKQRLSSEQGFFLTWGLAPAVFFTFVKQLHPAYILPSLPGLAIYFALLIKDKEFSLLGKKFNIEKASFSVGVIYVFLIIISAQIMNSDHSTEDIMRYVANNTKEAKLDLVVLQTKSQSPYFYANAWENELGKEIDVHYSDVNKIDTSEFGNLIVRIKELKKIPKNLLSSYDLKTQLGRWAWYQKKIS